MYNTEKLPVGTYQETQWQINDNIIIPQDELYTLAGEAEIGGHLIDNPITYTDPNASDFDESHTQGPNFVNVSRSYFHCQNDSQNLENCPTSDPSVAHPSNPKLHGHSQDVETTRDLGHKDSSTRASESNGDIGTA